MDNTLVENINVESHDSPIDDGDESLFNSLFDDGDDGDDGVFDALIDDGDDSNFDNTIDDRNGCMIKV